MIRNFDDEQVKIGMLEAQVQALLVGMEEYYNQDTSVYLATNELMQGLAAAVYELVLAQIECYYWQCPHLAYRLRSWISNSFFNGPDNEDSASLIFAAIKSEMPACQLESLLDMLNE